MLVNLDGKVALVTGGASGIGLATARRLTAAGARVVIGDVDAEGGAAAAAETGGRFSPLDVTVSAAWREVVDELTATEGAIDVAFLNAGVDTGVADLTALSDDAYRRAMAVNVDGVVYGVRTVVPAMPEGGAVVATASLAGLTPMALDPVYSATKHAVVGLIRSIAPGLAERGITANAVCPGYADTGLITGDAREQITVMDLPLLDTDDVAKAVLALLAAGGTGEAWFVQPGREPAPYVFRGVPGPGRS